jgi:cytochrome c-L
MIRSWRALGAGLALLLAAGGSHGEIQFRHTLDDEPLRLDLKPDETMTAAVKQFHRSGENPYRGDAAAIAQGKALYQRWCRACHLDSGAGRIGPSLIDGRHRYPRTGTDIGMFEIIYAGGAGAMQAFGRRLGQDEILKVMAYVSALAAAGR